MNRLVLLAVLLGLSMPVVGRTIKGVELPERVIARDGSELRLHGAGVRDKFLFDIHVGALYLPSTGQDAATILERDQPARVEMHFLYRKADAERMAEGWREAFAANNDARVIDSIAQRIERFAGMWPSARRGDVFVMEYLPGRGTQVRVNGQRLGTIAGEVFFTALLGVFLGPNPGDPDLKRGMLGRDQDNNTRD